MWKAGKGDAGWMYVKHSGLHWFLWCERAFKMWFMIDANLESFFLVRECVKGWAPPYREGGQVLDI